jgi:predicted TIM-barrel fold metal-dependent hydrolase
VAGAPLPDPDDAGAAARLDAELEKTKAPVVGEVHVRQVSRKIDRDSGMPAFGKILDVCARRGVPIVIHDELNEAATAALERALTAHPKATIILAHAGEAPAAKLEPLLSRHRNLLVDLSGMHFQRTPALAPENGPIDPGYKALIEKMPDRFLMGIDVWAPRLFEPAMLDRLLTWARRVLGQLSPDVAERVAWKNATAVFHLE